MKKKYSEPCTMTQDVMSLNNLLTESMQTHDTPAKPTGDEESDGLAKGQNIWENEW